MAEVEVELEALRVLRRPKHLPLASQKLDQMMSFPVR